MFSHCTFTWQSIVIKAEQVHMTQEPIRFGDLTLFLSRNPYNDVFFRTQFHWKEWLFVKNTARCERRRVK